MNIEKTTLIKLSKEDVEEIIKEYLSNKGFAELSSLTFQIRKHQWTDGYGSMECDYEELLFEGAEIKTR